MTGHGARAALALVLAAAAVPAAAQFGDEESGIGTAGDVGDPAAAITEEDTDPLEGGSGLGGPDEQPDLSGERFEVEDGAEIFREDQPLERPLDTPRIGGEESGAGVTLGEAERSFERAVEDAAERDAGGGSGRAGGDGEPTAMERALGDGEPLSQREKSAILAGE